MAKQHTDAPQSDPHISPSPAPTGRTQWDVLGDVIQRLGPGVLILVGALFALFMFLNTYGEWADSAHQKTESAYVSAGEINDRAVTTINKALDAFERLQAISDNESRKATAAVTSQREAETARIAAETQLANTLQRERDQLDAIRINHEAKMREIQARSAKFEDDLRTRTAKAGTLREDIAKLIEDIRTQTARNDTAALETIILQVDDFRTKHLVDANQLITAFAQNPSAETAKALSDLEGVSADSLLKIARANSQNFQAWTRFGEPKSDDWAFVATLSSDPFSVRNILVFTLDQNRIYTVEWFDRILIFSTPSPTNWDVTQYLALVGSPTGGYAAAPADERAITDGTWTLADVVNYEEFDGSVRAKTISGQAPTLQVADINLVTKKNSDIATLLRDAADEDTRLVLDGLQRAKTFSPAKLIPPSLGSGRSDAASLRKAVVAALDAAVRRDESTRTAMTGVGFAREDWGRLAAAALRDGFRLVKLDDTRSPNTVHIVFQYQDTQWGRTTTQRIRLALTLKGTTPDAHWLATALTEHDSPEFDIRQQSSHDLEQHAMPQSAAP